MKRIMAALLTLVMLLALAGCGGKKKDAGIVGYYTLTSADMGGMEMDLEMLKNMGMADGVYLQLNEGGTGEMSMEVGKSFAITYDEKAATITVPEAGMTFPFTVEGDNITVTMESESTTMVYTRSTEVAGSTAAAPAAGSTAAAPTADSTAAAPAAAEDTGIVGYYTLTSADMGGMELDQDMLKNMGMADGMFLQLDADGTGVLCAEIGKNVSITYDEQAGTINVAEAGMTFPFTVEGDTITVNMEESATTMCFTRSTGGAAPAAGSGSAAATTDTFSFDNVTVASSINDAFGGASAQGSGAQGSESGFVSPTTTLKMNTTWYGIMSITNAEGPSAQNCSKDVIGVLNTTSNGRPYFEVSTDSSMESQFIMLSLYITLDSQEDGFTADIGDEDAWVINRYIEPEEWWYFSPTLNNGALDMNYHYVDPDDGSSYDLRFFLREDRTEWDEENDPLPPSYEEYKEAIS